MNTKVTEAPGSSISRQKLLGIVRGLSDGEKDPVTPKPEPPGPFDFLFRTALRRTFGAPEVTKEFKPGPVPLGDPAPFFGAAADLRLALFAGRNPALWDLLGGVRFGLADLNPQPLPPRTFFLRTLAEVIVERAEMLYELGAATAGEERGIIIVSGYLRRVTDDLCPEPFRFRWPFPWPRPNWFRTAFSALDLVVLAAEFEEAAQIAAPSLSPVLGQTSERCFEASVTRA